MIDYKNKAWPLEADDDDTSTTLDLTPFAAR